MARLEVPDSALRVAVFLDCCFDGTDQLVAASAWASITFWNTWGDN
jgi:hypothetical protein